LKLNQNLNSKTIQGEKQYYPIENNLPSQVELSGYFGNPLQMNVQNIQKI
jgi:hypothetical protein